jgi:hypothetical protein
MIFEGVLRKWLFFNYSTQLYFLKDFFLLIIYILAIKYGLLWKNIFSKFLLVFALLVTAPSIFIYELNTLGILSFLLGVRSYWMFLPLALIVSHLFTFEDVVKFCEKNVYFIFPYFALILIQSYSSPESVINSGYNNGVMNPERPSGFFTYTTQNTFYLIFLISCFYVWFLQKKNLEKKNLVSILIYIFLLCSILILLKSRAVYIYSLFLIISSCWFIFTFNQNRILNMKRLTIIIITPLIFFSTSKIFHKSYEFSKNRVNTDNPASEFLEIKMKQNKQLFFSFLKTKSESDEVYNNKINKISSETINFCKNNSSICRVLIDFVFLIHIPEPSLKAFGIGYGTAAVTELTKNKKLFLGEGENVRIMNELGKELGTFFVTFKYIFSIIFFIFFMKKNKNAQILIPILAFCIVLILIGPITYTTSFVSFIFWMLTGLLFSSFKHKSSLIKIKK